MTGVTEYTPAPLIRRQRRVIDFDYRGQAWSVSFEGDEPREIDLVCLRSSLAQPTVDQLMAVINLGLTSGITPVRIQELLEAQGDNAAARAFRLVRAFSTPRRGLHLVEG